MEVRAAADERFAPDRVAICRGRAEHPVSVGAVTDAGLAAAALSAVATSASDAVFASAATRPVVNVSVVAPVAVAGPHDGAVMAASSAVS
eukprot:5594500-Prymnesium_polylepis.1